MKLRTILFWAHLTAGLVAGTVILIMSVTGTLLTFQHYARSTLTLDRRTGADIRWEPYEATSGGQKVRGWMRFAHTGELGGLPGEAAAGLASAGGGFLVWTGVALALRRLGAWLARRRTALDRDETQDARVA
jgi:uncharacterized iron-regulated membrane protein